MDWRILTLLTILPMSTYTYLSPSTWNELGETTGLLLRDCWTRAAAVPEKHVALMIRCLQRRSLTALKRALSSDVIPLTDNLELVRFRKGNNDTSRRMSLENTSNTTHAEWQYQVFDLVSEVFTTHIVKLNVSPDNSITSEARLRRRHQMMPIFMFGLVGLGMIMIPMGFQFLAVLGGKALLLAKMALMLSSIQGLKKVATSNIHYGLYAAQPPWFDRKTEDYPPHLEDYYSQVPAGDYPYVKRVSTVSR